mmetsp:Transcript_7893/g.14188  ORF Transcript_7893/g.14188 Transcript_7893/m.14188 type:complete len:110 (-) Transcript_7893:215-544(-)
MIFSMKNAFGDWNTLLFPTYERELYIRETTSGKEYSQSRNLSSCNVGTILTTYQEHPVPTPSGRRQWPERKLRFTPVVFEGGIILRCYEKNCSTSFMMRSAKYSITKVD